jgi:hypothetical protein
MKAVVSAGQARPFDFVAAPSARPAGTACASLFTDADLHIRLRIFDFNSFVISLRSEFPQILHSHRARSVPSGTMVASRSGPVEIIPISTCKKSAINLK